MEQPLDLLLELVGLLFADVVDPRLVAGQALVLQGAGHHRFIDLVELEVEEDDFGGDGGQFFGDVAIEFCALGIGLVAGVVKARVGAEAPHQLDEALELLDGERQHGAVGRQRDELAVIRLLDAARLVGGDLQVAGDLRRGRRGIKVSKVPLGHLAQRFRRFCRSTVRRVEGASHVVGAGMKSHHLLQ